MGTDLLFAFLSTAKHRLAADAIALELRARLPAGGLHFKFFLTFVWFCMVCTKLQ